MTRTDAHQIVHDVQEAFRGLAAKLSAITDKTASWYQSHGRTPKTEDALANGNVSPVTHYMRYARQYEAAEPGSGRMLSNRVFAALDMEFAEKDLRDVTQSHLHVDVIDEVGDVQRWLAKFDLHNATRNELLGFERECNEANDAICAARARARVRLRELELERSAELKAVGKR